MKNTRKPATPYAFTRDPRFTPASLTAHQLGRIEALAVAIVKRMTRNAPASKQDADDFAGWWMDTARGGFGKQREIARRIRRWFSDDADAWTYLLNCMVWVIACGNNGGWIARNTNTSDRAYWAQARGSH